MTLAARWPRGEYRVGLPGGRAPGGGAAGGGRRAPGGGPGGAAGAARRRSGRRGGRRRATNPATSFTRLEDETRFYPQNRTPFLHRSTPWRRLPMTVTVHALSSTSPTMAATVCELSPSPPILPDCPTRRHKARSVLTSQEPTPSRLSARHAARLFWFALCVAS